MTTNRPESNFAFLADALAGLDAKNLRRRMRPISPAAGPRVERDGRWLIHLCSNNYLGLATDTAVINAASQAAIHAGVGAGASRLVTGTLPVHVDLETAIAELKHTDAALVFPTGFAANMGTIAALAGPRDVIYSDALNHASIVDGCRLSGATVRKYRHADMAHLRELMALDTGENSGSAPATDDAARRRFIVTDGVFSMDGDLAPLADLAQIAAESGAMLLVDDAHGTGVLGENGSGTAEALGITDGIHAHIGTLSKALGGQGGFVAGSRDLIEFLLNSARSYIFTTALAPPLAAAALAAIGEIHANPEARENLRANAKHLRAGLAELGFTLVPGTPGHTTPIIPILIGEAERAVALSLALEAHGVLVSAIRPPTVPKGTSRLRVTVMATHTEDDLTQALAAFATAGKETGVLP